MDPRNRGTDQEVVDVRSLVQFSREEIQAEHIWLHRLSVPCALQITLFSLTGGTASAVPPEVLTTAVSAIAPGVQVRLLPKLLRTLATIPSEQAMSVSEQLWQMYAKDAVPSVQQAHCLVDCTPLLERLTLHAVSNRSLHRLAQLACFSERLSALLFRLLRSLFAASGRSIPGTEAVTSRLLPPPPLQSPAAALLLVPAAAAAARLERLCRRRTRHSAADLQWLAALYPRQMTRLCDSSVLRH